MLEAAWQRLDSGIRYSLPFVTTLLFMFISVVPWPVPWLGPVAPPLGLITLYYWAIHRPDLFRPSMAFVIGLLNDVLNSLPLGLSALVFVAAHQLVLRQRRFFVGHSFFMMWVGFALMISVMLLIQWIVLSFYGWRLVPFLPVLMQDVLAIVIFPLPCCFLIYLQRIALAQE